MSSSSTGAVAAPNTGSFADFISTSDAARLLGTSYQNAYLIASSGAFGDPVVIGGRYFYDRALAVAEIEARLRRRETAKKKSTGEHAAARS
jgi:hypothetical protein